MGADEVSLELPAVPETLDEVLDVLHQAWERNPDVTERDRMRFEMGLGEIVGNVVEHALRGVQGPDRTVSVEIAIGEDTLRAVVVDDGAKMDLDLNDVAMPDATATHGRGLAIALQVLDELHYERLTSLNRWWFRCKREV